MKFYEPKEPIYARDLLVSIASRLPNNLIVPSDKFDWIFLLNDVGIEKLHIEAEKKDPYRPLYVNLYTKVKEHNTCPNEFDYKSFDWEKVVEIEISGNASDAWDNRLNLAFQYVSIVFITKA